MILACQLPEVGLSSLGGNADISCCTSCKARLITESTGQERRVLLWNLNVIFLALPTTPIKRSTNKARLAISSNTAKRTFSVDRLEVKPSPKCALFKSRLRMRPIQYQPMRVTKLNHTLRKPASVINIGTQSVGSMVESFLRNA